MATKHQVLALYRQNPNWSSSDIAAKLDCHPAYVRATITRNGLPPRHVDLSNRTLEAQRRFLESRERSLIKSLKNVREELQRINGILRRAA